MSDLLSQFHFIRPLWMIGLIIIPFLWFFSRKASVMNNDWSKVIQPELLKHLTPKQSNQSSSQPTTLICILLSLVFISLAGPSWKQKPTPVIQTGDDVVIILDLSLSMLATDVAPDRLTKAKQKLQDLLSYRKEGILH